jgi:hypothetical protein
MYFLLLSFRDKVVDFHWNASDPWTVVSVSDDCDTTGGGGTLQVIVAFHGNVLLCKCMDKLVKHRV